RAREAKGASARDAGPKSCAGRRGSGQTGGVSVEIRRIGDTEREAFVRSVMVPFLDARNDDDEVQHLIEYEASQMEPSRAWVAESRGRFVGNCCIYSMDLTLPAAPGQQTPVVPMAGISSVGVHPTHRRRGILHRMMSQMLADARERGEPIAALVASESIIYWRYGFGHATDRVNLTIDAKRAAFVRPAPELDLQLVDKDEALKVYPALFDRQRRTRAGEPNRTEGYWKEHLADRKNRRGGGRGV